MFIEHAQKHVVETLKVEHFGVHQNGHLCLQVVNGTRLYLQILSTSMHSNSNYNWKDICVCQHIKWNQQTRPSDNLN
jgi:hypothetical protein